MMAIDVSEVVQEFLLEQLAKKSDELRDMSRKLMTKEPDAETVKEVTFVLGGMFQLKRAGKDLPDGAQLRAGIFERHGEYVLKALVLAIHELQHGLEGARHEIAEEYARHMGMLMKTLDSPIDDADKIQHLRESLPKSEEFKALLKEHLGS